MDKTDAFDRMMALLTDFHSDFKDTIRTDAPIQGSDAVDYLVAFHGRVNTFFEDLNK